VRFSASQSPIPVPAVLATATIIETISAGITLQPGDIIATGTPEGVGIGFNPPKFLKSGDVMKITTEGLGCLENSIV
jgi:2-keto-4-pentenoate hydratase/2-oxohepta-3-ene-1,7-dioic acid hydratase in catechol pathway